MFRFRHAGVVLAAGISLTMAAAADGQGFGPPQQVAALTNASAVAYPPGDRARLFVLTLSGMVRVIENGALAPTACLDATAAVGNSANGATGLCFDPEYTTNRYFYIFHSARSDRVVLARYQMSATDPALADPASRLVLLQRPGLSQHTGGWIDFGKDGYLYLSGGDLWQDSNGSPQSVTTWTGKFFRLDVRGDDFPDDTSRNYAIPLGNPFTGSHPGLDEIWATGIRNAYRCSFDRLTGDLWIADVGGGLREEVNRQPANSAGGENYGWPCWEGNQFRSDCGPASMFTFPILDLTHGQNACIMGGYVYRGCANRAMQGRYVFSRCLGTPLLWSFNPAAPAATLVQHTVTGIAGQVLGFGEDADGELLVCSTAGLYKLTPPADAWIPDCNHNGRPDDCEIADGSQADANADGVLDSCTRLCPADFDANGALGVGDIFSFIGRWFGGHADADFNGAGGVTLQDVFDFLAAYFTGC